MANEENCEDMNECDEQSTREERTDKLQRTYRLYDSTGCVRYTALFIFFFFLKTS
jgi:hypothetical protein